MGYGTTGYQFADPFDDYTTASQIYEGTGGSLTYGSLFARFSAPAGLTGQGLNIGVNSFVRKNLPYTSPSRAIAGVAFNAQGVPGTTPALIISLCDSGTVQVSLRRNNAGQLQFFRGATAIGPLSAPLIAPGLWHYLEIDVTIDPASGSVTVWMDSPLSGVGSGSIFTQSGLNTRSTANSWANQVQLGDPANVGGWYDDLYCFDTTGTSLNSRLGDNQMVTKMPSGPGDLTHWTPNGAAANWQCENSIPPNDSKYTSDSTVGDIDTYAMQSAGLTTAPLLVMQRNRWWKDDAAAHSMQSLIRLAGTNANGATQVLGSSPTFFDTPFPTDPSGNPWTAGNADSVQGGKYLNS